MTTRTALVTGASPGGLGSEFVLALQKQGFRVFATVRSADKGQHLSSTPNVELLIFDVTSPGGIKEAAKDVEEKTSGRVNLLMNNSGGGYHLPHGGRRHRADQEDIRCQCVVSTCCHASFRSHIDCQQRDHRQYELYCGRSLKRLGWYVQVVRPPCTTK